MTCNNYRPPVGEVPVQCPRCEGSGFIDCIDDPEGDGEPCLRCQGTGKIMLVPGGAVQVADLYRRIEILERTLKIKEAQVEALTYTSRITDQANDGLGRLVRDKDTDRVLYRDTLRDLLNLCEQLRYQPSLIGKTDFTVPFANLLDYAKQITN